MSPLNVNQFIEAVNSKYYQDVIPSTVSVKPVQKSKTQKKSTSVESDKPSLITKEKAQKLIMLAKVIKEDAYDDID